MSDEFEYDSKPVADDFRAFLVEGALLTETSGYPIIEEWMISELIPERLVPFDKLNEIDDISNVFICFYCNDKSLNKVRKNPKQYLKMFSRAKGIIGMDYSVFVDQPYVVQTYQIYNNLAYTFFYGLRHIGIIPNIRTGSETTSKEFYEALPKNSTVSIGTYGFSKTIEEKNRINQFIDELIENNHPRRIIVYGSLTKYAKEQLQRNNIKYYLYKPWIASEGKGQLYEWN